MTNTRTDDALPLSYLEVLDDEYWELLGQTNPSSPLRNDYHSARVRFATATPGTEDATQAQQELEDAERRFRHDLLARFHITRRSALCFSGGGIRSGTFGLGILQGLAAHAADDGGKPPRLLGEFDYLSTVSGGGYVGSWFSAWAARESHAVGTNGVSRVIRQLAKGPDTGFDPEPAALHHLRVYSNYLIPRLGLFSGDTWAVIGTVVRNIFLNWLVLVPLLAAVLLAPLGALDGLQASAADWVRWTVLVVGFLFGVVATAYIGFDLPSAGNARGTYARFVGRCLIPLVLAATCLNTFWGWLPDGSGGEWWDVVALGRRGVQWWHLAVFGAVMHSGGMLLGIVVAMLRFHRPPPKTGLYATAAAIVTGGLGGALMFAIVRTIASTPSIVCANDSGCLDRIYVCLAFPVVVIVFLIAGALLVGLTSYITEDKDREWWARSGGMLLAVALVWVAFAAVVLFSQEVIDKITWTVSSLLAAVSGWATARLGSSAATASGRREETAPAAQSTSGLSFASVKEVGARLALPIFLFALVLILSQANVAIADRIHIGPAVLVLALGYVLTSIGASYFINVNNFSLHAMYKLRLARAYLGASNPHRAGGAHPFTGFDDLDDMPIAALSREKPLHVVNMALNLVGGENLAWQQRKAESFTSTRLHTGSCRVGYRPSSEYGGMYKQSRRKWPITLGTAMTISGAAASPNMGYNSSPLLTLVMTLFNARLGWWLGNPGIPGKYWRYPGPLFGVRPFIDEALGFTTDRNRWVYLSDGGHFDNLGLYEMVIRRCGLIVVCDAGADSKFTFEDLGNAVRKVRIDLGVSIELDGRMPAGFTAAEGEDSAPHCAIGRIRYDAVDPGAPADGVLVYIKSSLTGDEPADVLHYAAQHPAFPHETTTDQFFDEAQFESYRRLGLHIVERICDRSGHISPPDETFDLAEFVKRATEYCKPFGPSSTDANLRRLEAPITRIWKTLRRTWRMREARRPAANGR